MNPNTKDWGEVNFDITTDQSRNIEPCCRLALSGHRRATHYQVMSYDDNSTALYLFWTDAKGSIELPFELDSPQLMSEFISTWLEKKAVYPESGDCGDGDYEKGVRIANTSSHNDVNSFYCVACVEPEWVYYGK